MNSKRWILALLTAGGLLCGQAPVIAQDGAIVTRPPGPSGGGGSPATWDGGAFSASATGPTGCVTPAYSFTADAASGLCLAAAGNPFLSSGVPAGGGEHGRIELKGLTGGAGYAYFDFYDDGALDSGVRAFDNTLQLWSAGVTVGVFGGTTFTSVPITIQGSTSPLTLTGTSIVNGFDTTIDVVEPTADHIITFPDATGDVAVIAADGFAVRTGAQTWVARSFESGDGSIIWVNPAGTAGNPDATVDTAVFSRFASGTADASGNCSVGTSFTRTDTNEVWECTATNTWTKYATTGGTVDVSDLSDGTDGELITWDADGAPATVAVGTAGHVLTSNGAGAAPTFQAVAGGSTFDPSTTVMLYEEFSSGSGTTTAQVGNLGMQFTGIAVGTCVAGPGTATNPGVGRITAHATSDDSGCVYHMGTHALWDAAIWTNNVWSLDAVVILGSNSTAITNSGFFFGLSNSATNLLTHSSGIMIERDTDLSHAAFVAKVCDSSTTGCQSAGDDTNQTSAISTITPSAGNAYRFRIRQSLTEGPGSTRLIAMRVNNETEITFCSSGCTDTLAQVPSAAMFPVIGYVTRTGTNLISSDADYLQVNVTLTRYTP